MDDTRKLDSRGQEVSPTGTTLQTVGTTRDKEVRLASLQFFFFFFFCNPIYRAKVTTYVTRTIGRFVFSKLDVVSVGYCHKSCCDSGLRCNLSGFGTW